MEGGPSSTADMGAATGSATEAGLKSVRLAAQPEGGDASRAASSVDVLAKLRGASAGGKMHRAGRKAAVMSILEKNLGRGRDPLSKGDLERVLGFLHSDPGLRTQAEIGTFLGMLKKFPFLDPYSDEQRRQLAGIALYSRFTRGSHPAFSRAPPSTPLAVLVLLRLGTRGGFVSVSQLPDSHGCAVPQSEVSLAQAGATLGFQVRCCSTKKTIQTRSTSSQPARSVARPSPPWRQPRGK